MDFVRPKNRDAVIEYSRKLVAQGRSAPFVKHKLIRIDGTVLNAEVATNFCGYCPMSHAMMDTQELLRANYSI